jgi:hypothetical protein
VKVEDGVKHESMSKDERNSPGEKTDQTSLLPSSCSIRFEVAISVMLVGAPMLTLLVFALWAKWKRDPAKVEVEGTDANLEYSERVSMQ